MRCMATEKKMSAIVAAVLCLLLISGESLGQVIRVSSRSEHVWRKSDQVFEDANSRTADAGEKRITKDLEGTVSIYRMIEARISKSTWNCRKVDPSRIRQLKAILSESTSNKIRLEPWINCRMRGTTTFEWCLNQIRRQDKCSSETNRISTNPDRIDFSESSSKQQDSTFPTKQRFEGEPEVDAIPARVSPDPPGWLSTTDDEFHFEPVWSGRWKRRTGTEEATDP